MHIVFLLNRYPGIGGIENITTILANLFVNELGYKVSVFSIFSQDRVSINGALEGENVKVVRSNNREIITSTFVEYMCNNPADVLVFQDSYAEIEYLLDYVIKPTRIITVEHNTPDCLLKGYVSHWKTHRWFSFSGLLKKILFPYIYWKIYKHQRDRHRLLVRKSDHYVVLSESFKSHLYSLWKIDDPKIISISNIKNDFGCLVHDNLIYNKKKKVLFVGRLTGQKGIDYLISIWKRIEKKTDEYELVIVGDGEERYKLEEEITRGRLRNVKLEGFRDNVCDYYAESSILFFTSIYEGFGLVLPEAMQFGVIPISFDSYLALNDIICDSHNGFIVKSFDIEAYVHTFMKLISMPEDKINILRKNATKSSEKFSSNIILKQWEKLFDDSYDNSVRK